MIFTYFMWMRYSCHDISTIVNLACENTEGTVGEAPRKDFLIKLYVCIFYIFYHLAYFLRTMFVWKSGVWISMNIFIINGILTIWYVTCTISSCDQCVFIIVFLPCYLMSIRCEHCQKEWMCINRGMDLLTVFEICLFPLVWIRVFETSKLHFAHDVRFVIFIFFEENNQKMTIENRIFSEKSPSLFLRTFRKNLRNKRIRKFSSFERK